MNLEKQELLNINGGAVRFGVIIGIGAAISFLIGVFDGLVRPLKCN